MGGHSLGGSITTAYATWDFDGTPGADDLAGLVYIDGGSNPTPVSAAQAHPVAADAADALAVARVRRHPGALPRALLGRRLATSTKIDPNGRVARSGLPVAARPTSRRRCRATNEAGFGYAVDTDTSPPNLAAAQVHAGRLAATGDPRPWDRAGDDHPDPTLREHVVRHRAHAASTAARGTTRCGSRSTRARSPRATRTRRRASSTSRPTHGHDLDRTRSSTRSAPRSAARACSLERPTLAPQSGIPPENLTLVDRHDTYAHNDPSAASPNNDFVDNLIPFLAKVSGDHHHHHHDDHHHESH